jgi:hypothetical protein
MAKEVLDLPIPCHTEDVNQKVYPQGNSREASATGNCRYVRIAGQWSLCCVYREDPRWQRCFIRY